MPIEQEHEKLQESSHKDSSKRGSGDNMSSSAFSGTGTFNRSTKSMMSQLEAQNSYRKDMRNLKMKAKQKKRV